MPGRTDTACKTPSDIFHHDAPYENDLGGKCADEGERHSVLSEIVVEGVRQMRNQVVDGALAGGLVLCEEAQGGHHREAAVLDLLQLHVLVGSRVC